MKNNIRYIQARNITLYGALINFVLAGVKMFVGVIAHSHALFADGIHSLSDLFTDALVLVTSRYGSREADELHPYGHARIETAGSVFVAVLLILAGVGIAIEAARYLHFTSDPMVPGMLALWIAIISIVFKEGLYHFTMHVARRWQSKVLEANAWHHRSDAASSFVVVIGIIVSLMGYPMVDALAAILIGFKISYMGAKLAWSGIRELVDTGLDEETLQQIQDTISQTPGVIALHQLRTRSMGGTIFLDLHILVDPYVSVSEGHHIGEQVRKALIAEHPNISDITVHVDPEDDEIVEPSAHLPTRGDVVQFCQERWHGLVGAEHIQKIVLHYLSGNIHIEVWIGLNHVIDIDEVDAVREQYQQALSGMPAITSVRLLFH